MTLYQGQTAMRNYKSLPGMTAVSGIGDEAYWNEQLGSFVVRKGERVVNIDFKFTPVQREWAEQIARGVVQKL